MVSNPGCLGPRGSVVPSPGSPLLFFFSASLPPPLPFFFVVLLFFLRFFFCFFFRSCLSGCGVCWCVLLCALCPSGGRCALLLCHLVLPGCARSVCVVACHVSVLWCAFCFARWCVACVCWAGSCSVLLAPVAVAWSSVVARGCVLSCGAVPSCSGVPPVVCCAAVCVVSCWWCRVVSFALAGAACCRLWLPPVPCWVWWPAVVFRLCVLSRVLLAGRLACCPAVCCGLLLYPAPLCCVLCSVVLCCRVVPCCGTLLSVLLRWRCCVLSL